MSREATREIIELAEGGCLSWDSIARECLNRMSEDDVADMIHETDWADWVDDDEEQIVQLNIKERNK